MSGEGLVLSWSPGAGVLLTLGRGLRLETRMLSGVYVSLSYLSVFPFFFFPSPALVSFFSLQVDFLCSFNHITEQIWLP